tara:strand:+ start:259 stop:450 length:192 start_codon:yes stop_codon:yes gene_type:complete
MSKDLFDERELRQVKECLEDYALEYMGNKGLLDYFVENEMNNNLESREEYIQRGWILEEDDEA